VKSETSIIPNFQNGRIGTYCFAIELLIPIMEKIIGALKFWETVYQLAKRKQFNSQKELFQNS
jgi:hypothetical protein